MLTYTLQRLREDAVSTDGVFKRPDGSVLCQILERGAQMMGGHPRIEAGGPYPLRLKAIGTSHLDPVGRRDLETAYKGMIEVCNVPGRSEILIHPANKYSDLLGCLAPGLKVVPTVRGYEIPGGQSGPAFKDLYLEIVPHLLPDGDGAELFVIDIPKAAA
jgi:Family of unknown function (DUF5675)